MDVRVDSIFIQRVQIQWQHLPLPDDVELLVVLDPCIPDRHRGIEQVTIKAELD
jgi:hypothetical protein